MAAFLPKVRAVSIHDKIRSKLTAHKSPQGIPAAIPRKPVVIPVIKKEKVMPEGVAPRLFRIAISFLRSITSMTRVVTMEKDERILRNYFWRWGKPKKYNFRKYFAIALKLKEKELEKASRKWQYSELDKKENNNSK